MLAFRLDMFIHLNVVAFIEGKLVKADVWHLHCVWDTTVYRKCIGLAFVWLFK